MAAIAFDDIPVKLSRKMSWFMDREEASRWEVSQAVLIYVKKVAIDSNRQGTEVFEQITGDDVLNDLFRSQNEDVTLLNYMTFLECHFPMEEVVD